ncbi:MAG: myxococcus cysteine-rich repeat containing protein [Minicystis sp.]
MPGRHSRLLRVLAFSALAPFLAGAHCNDDCGKPKTSLVARPLERTIYGPALLVADRGATLGDTLEGFDRRSLRVDPSRPVAVLLASSASWSEVGRLDGSKLKAGDRGPSFKVVGIVDHAAKVPIFESPSAIGEAKRAGWDAIVLIPRTPGGGPWELAVSMEMGRTVQTARDEKTDACVERAGTSGPVPSFRLGSLPVRCGDGVRQDEEECDDGNRRNGDGCSSFCTKER